LPCGHYAPGDDQRGEREANEVQMTYDLAVWEGERPEGDRAGEVFAQLYSRYLDVASVPPSRAIEEYVAALLVRWVDMTEDEEDVSPWSDGPMINNASGPILYFAMRYSMAEEVSAAAARMAADRGLICFDPQWNCLRPSADES
jgi:hypothetical protein